MGQMNRRLFPMRDCRGAHGSGRLGVVRLDDFYLIDAEVY